MRLLMHRSRCGLRASRPLCTAANALPRQRAGRCGAAALALAVHRGGRLAGAERQTEMRSLPPSTEARKVAAAARRDDRAIAAARATHPPPRRLVKNGPPAPRRRCVLDGRGLRADRVGRRAARRRAGARAGPRRGLADDVERAHRIKRGRLRRLLLPDVRPRAPRRDHRVPRAAARGRLRASLPRKKTPPDAADGRGVWCACWRLLNRCVVTRDITTARAVRKRRPREQFAWRVPPCFFVASATSSPCSFVDTRSSECGADPDNAGVVGSQ